MDPTRLTMVIETLNLPASSGLSGELSALLTNYFIGDNNTHFININYSL